MFPYPRYPLPQVRPTPGTPYPSGAGQHVGNPEGYTATDIVARGAGLHVGHPEGYTATDIVARYKRMRGFNVLHPMGWDAFGLPAEQYAIETGTHPRVTTERNIGRFRSQLKALGFSYDWQREVSTTDPDYYRWTQWIFLQILNRGLAYQADVAVNWCPALGTVLANEEVVDGLSERGGHPVIRKPMRQWMLRITEYADRLLDDLDGLDWPESVKEMQRNWIGRSEGAEVEFAIADVADGSASVRVFTTRPDTICGATYLVLAPEHPLVTSITSEQQRAAVEAYVVAAGQKSDLERTDLAKGKTGVPTGAEAVNPVTGERIPVWVADYVLARRTGLAKSKTGHAMGAEAVNPVTGERIPVWVADYVLASYGTGAIICQLPRMMHVTSHALLLRRLERHMMHVTSHALTHPSSPLSRCLSYHDLASPCYTAATARGPSWQCRDTTRETSNHFPFALPPSPSLPAATARGSSWQCGDTTPEARLKAPSFTLLFALPHPSHPICCSYGTGAIMAVPAHDSRDLEFAQTFSLPVRQVVRQAAQRSGGGKGKKASGEAAREEEEAAIEEAYAGSGVMVNSGYERTGVDLNGLDNTAAGDAVVAWLEERGLGKKQVRHRGLRLVRQGTGVDLNGLDNTAARDAVVAWLEERGLGKKQINYKLRDWLFARQRYWGEPFPVVLVPGEDGRERVVGVPESQLPVVLPEMDDFNPTGTGEPPLAKATDWVNTTDPASGLPARRETNTMPQWAVDLYVGGAEHSVLHLLYARFWHKVLYDIGAVSTKEPFQCLVNQGMILGEFEFTAYRDTASGALLSADAAAKRPAGECVPERVPETAVLYDIGAVSTKEPFQCLVNQGMILGEVEFTAYRDTASGALLSADAAAKRPAGEGVPERVLERGPETAVLYDIGAVSTKEPFQCLVNQGMILGEVEFTAYRDTASGALLSADAAAKRPAGECVPERVPEEAVEKKGEGYVLRADPSVGVSARAHKMSKSRGNVVNPDHVVFEFGADSLRLYEMFMGPLRHSAWDITPLPLPSSSLLFPPLPSSSLLFPPLPSSSYPDDSPAVLIPPPLCRETKVWSTKGVEGVHRFLARVWRLLVGQADPATGQYRSHGVAPSVVDDAPSEEQLRALHACIHKADPATRQYRAAGVAPSVVDDAPSEEQLRALHACILKADPATGQYRIAGVAPSVVDDDLSEEQLRALHACIHKGVAGRGRAGGGRAVRGRAVRGRAVLLVGEGGEACSAAPHSRPACTHQVTEEVEAMRFNTAIAAMMEFTNAAYKWPSVPKDAARPLVLLLSPFAPHVAEELWQRLGGTSSLAYEPWPQALPQYLVEDTIALPVQVNGKVRATLQVAVGVEQEAAVAAALDHPNVARLVEGKSVRKTIFVKGRILNLVVG
ncbi:unnamed protein product [Closterium sp. NIES-65]|nr:unnamed protein product [Closterium sp. NIES-65]